MRCEIKYYINKTTHIILLIVAVLFCCNSIAQEYIDLICQAPPPKSGHVVNTTDAAFINVQSFSTRVFRDCNGGNCLNSPLNSQRCSAPSGEFSITSINTELTSFIVSNRCTGNLMKYESLEENNFTGIFELVEENLLFQINNQIFSGTNMVAVPFLTINVVSLELEIIIIDRIDEENISYSTTCTDISIP